MKRFLTLAAAITLSLVPTLRAAVLFTDDFTTGGAVGSQSGGAGAGKVVILPNGFSRSVAATDVTYAVNGFDTYNLQIFAGAGGFLDLNASAGAAGTALLTYSNSSAPLTITPDDVLRFTFIAADAPNFGSINVHAVLNPGGTGTPGDPAEYDSTTVALTTGGPQTVDLPLAVGSAGLQTQSFEVFITSAAGLDYRLDSLSIQSVPEPAALAMVAAGGLLMRRRR